VIRTLDITPQPTAGETREILFRLGHELTAFGARVHHDIVGGFRFRMPLSLRASLGFLHAVSSGRVTIGAASGEPWRVRYELRFSLLRIVTIALTGILVIVGLHWPRTTLLNAIAVLWLAAYGLPFVRANREFRRLVDSAVNGTAL
jgi:hypothetical protein